MREALWGTREEHTREEQKVILSQEEAFCPCKNPSQR